MPRIQRFLYKLILAVVRLLLLTLVTIYLQELRQEQLPVRRDEIDNRVNLDPSDTDEEDNADSGIEQ